jgi:hypothetical protein
MVQRFFRKLHLYFKPPKKGDVFYGDPTHFVCQRPVEQILFGLKDKYGNSTWQPIPSFYCYKITIESDSMPSYYICKAQVMCKSQKFQLIEWQERCQPKRIDKYLFKTFVLDGLLKKGDK